MNVKLSPWGKRLAAASRISTFDGARLLNMAGEINTIVEEGPAAAPSPRGAIYLINPISGRGHLDAYARLYARSLVELGYRVVLIAAEDGGCREYFRRTGLASDSLAVLRSADLEGAELPVALSRFDARRPVASTVKRIREIIERDGVPGLAKYAITIFKQFAQPFLPAAFPANSDPRPTGISFSPWIRAIAAAQARLGCAPSIAIFLYLDMMDMSAQAVADLDQVAMPPWLGILFHPRGATGTNASIERYFQSRKARGAIFLVPSAIREYEARLSKQHFALVPDVADLEIADNLPPIAREARRLAGDRKIVLLVGTVSSHKGVVDLLQVISAADASRFFFALVGEVHWETFAQDEPIIRRFYRDPPENVFVHEGYLPEERDYNALVASCDLIYAVYKGFNSSSNSLTKAAGLRRPILVAQETLMGNRVASARIGDVAPEGNPPAILAALEHLAMEDLEKFDFEGYARKHSIESLKSVLAASLPRWIDSDRCRSPAQSGL